MGTKDEAGCAAVRRGARVVQRAVTMSAVGLLAMCAPVAAAQMALDRDPAESAPPWAVEAQRLAVRYGCTPFGLPSGEIPARAVVRVGGTVRTTSFARGWAVHRGDRPGVLVSVCAR